MFLLDHEQVPDEMICSLEPIGIPAIALTRRDWDFLFDQLRSTTAVLDYLFRAAAKSAVALGEEPVRYYEFAAADAEGSPAPSAPMSPHSAEHTSPFRCSRKCRRVWSRPIGSCGSSWRTSRPQPSDRRSASPTGCSSFRPGQTAGRCACRMGAAAAGHAGRRTRSAGRRDQVALAPFHRPLLNPSAHLRMRHALRPRGGSRLPVVCTAAPPSAPSTDRPGRTDLHPRCSAHPAHRRQPPLGHHFAAHRGRQRPDI